jgi:demethylmenaquinone methyltransferase/2-methoxy-6-polyprenyl-1,4-benzoquinol methylase
LLKFRARDGRDPRELDAMDLTQHLDDKVNKTKYVRTMFDVIAPGYDAFTRLFSFGMDRAWKAALIREASERTVERPRIVDLACGTGDLGIALARLTASPLVLGIDLSSQMLAEAKSRVTKESGIFLLAACDILALCLADASVDVVTIGYGLRNTGDASVALAEIARVLKPGGLLVNLDFHRPVGPLWRELFLWYMWNAGRIAGWLWHRQPATYGYLAPSIRRYFSIPEFEAALVRAGFEVEWRAKRLGGAIGIHIARRTGTCQRL